MPVRDLGEVKGKDGGIGDVSAEYVDNGGEPSVEIETQGDNQAKGFIFRFKNLVRSALTNDQIDRIANDEVVTSSNVLTGAGATSLWAKVKEKFALKFHTHGTTNIQDEAITTAKIADEAVTQAKIADGAVGETQLEQSLRNSIFQMQGTSWGSSTTVRVKEGVVYLATINHVLLQLFTTGSPAYLMVCDPDSTELISRVDAGAASSPISIRGKNCTFAFSSDRKTITINASAMSTMYVFGV